MSEPKSRDKFLKQMETLLAAKPGMHPSAARFHQLLKEIGLLHDQKQQDYGRENDPFANVRSAEEWGIPGWVYAMLRIGEKCHRLQAMHRNGKLANESAQDSFPIGRRVINRANESASKTVGRLVAKHASRSLIAHQDAPV